MATPRRRSGRLNGRSAAQRATTRKTPLSYIQLGSLIERDETPEAHIQSSIDGVLSTPATNATIKSQIAQLSTIKTPKTEPRASHAEMHPKTIHQTTSKAPDSGLKLGFADLPLERRQSLAEMQNTPSKADTLNKTANVESPSFEFKFRSESHLSNEAQKLMDNLRDEAVRIKAQMQAEKDAQDEKDDKAHEMFSGFIAAGRKIARPKGKAGRFSDVHMAEFKKMDSIANHASAFRFNHSFAQPTQQSLKRSGSKAGLDEPERPRTAGKTTPRRRQPPSFDRGITNASLFKSIPMQATSERLEISSPAKRQRQSEFTDVSSGRAHEQTGSQTPKVTPMPQSMYGIRRSLLSPTKASLARTSGTKAPAPFVDKPSMLPRSNSFKSLRATFEASRPVQNIVHKPVSASASKMPRSESSVLMRPLPPVPNEQACSSVNKRASTLHRSQSNKSLASSSKMRNFSSKLPTLAGLKSILRSPRAPPALPEISAERPGTPKRPNTATEAAGSTRKVDFTPSVKSRYAMKLAADSPKPAKLHQVALARPSAVLFGTSAYTMEEENDIEEMNEEWEDAESEIEYPTLPPSSPTSAPVIHTRAQKAKELNRRESNEFKSIFTTLHHPSRPEPSTLSAVDTTVNETSSTAHANKVLQSPSNISKQSPSTIRRVRPSNANEVIQPFEDTIKTVPHGLPGKKRRRESNINNEQHRNDDDAKENRRLSFMPQVPGGWKDTIPEADEGEKRAGKRVRVEKSEEREKPQVKKASAARQAAAKSAKERKGKGVLSLSRLNMLARPKGL